MWQKMFSGVSRTTAAPVVLQEPGVLSLNIQRRKRVATFWNSLQSLFEDHAFSAMLCSGVLVPFLRQVGARGFVLSGLRYAGLNYHLPLNGSPLSSIDLQAPLEWVGVGFWVPVSLLTRFMVYTYTTMTVLDMSRIDQRKCSLLP